MSYGIYFDSSVSGEALRQALHTRYGIDPDLVYVGPDEGLMTYPGSDPIVVINPSSGGMQFDCELRAGQKLADITKATELDLARALCLSAVTRALVDDGGPAPDYWFLVTRDGSYGRVMTDPDADNLIILNALEPIPGEPDLTVLPPPDWARTW